ncbi:hypothetical protein C8R44DRAFT_866138 [Mycena epipterygia]|nr:hypothetical protein C8R44DRAFT_866138 [Mycena epipterygia]
MALRSHPTLGPRGRGSGRPPADDTGATDTSSALTSSSLYGRRPATTETSTINAPTPSLSSRGFKPTRIGRLARQSVVVSESNRPGTEGIMLAEPFPTAVEATLPDFAPMTAVEAEPTPLHEPLTPLMHTQDALHPNWCVRVVIYLVAFLHTHYHVTFRACAIILSYLNLLFTSLPGNLLGNSRIPLTLKTVFARLGSHNRFTIHPFVQPVSWSYSDLRHGDSLTHWMVDLRTTRNLSGLNGNRIWSLLSSCCLLHLKSFSLDLEWFLRLMRGKLARDADVWKTLRGHDKELFFFGPSAKEEVRLGVSFSLDWFGRKTSSYGPSHSSGVMSFCIQNLDMSQMYRADNLILNQMPPGPQEPTGQQLQNYLKIVVDDLLKLYEDGIVVKTPEHPNGKLF